MTIQIVIALLAVLVMLVLFFRFALRRIVIYEYERGLRYHLGQFKDVLGPGQHWYFPYLTRIFKVDVRPVFATIGGQEVLTADGVTLKASLAASYEIADPNLAINRVQSYQAAIYLQLQMALREIVCSVQVDELLADRNQFAQRLKELTDKKAEEIGLRLLTVNLKDIMFPGELKRIFSQVVKAQKEGLAALEKARGETAALRNLANAAKLVENNPALMQLRLLQSLGETSGNTVVLGMSAPGGVLPVHSERAGKPGL